MVDSETAHFWGYYCVLDRTTFRHRPQSQSVSDFTAAPIQGAKGAEKAKYSNSVPKFYVSAICDLAPDITLR